MGAIPATITYLCHKRGTVDSSVLLRYDLNDSAYMIVDKQTYYDLPPGSTFFLCGFAITVIDRPSSRLKSVHERYRLYVSHFPSLSECFE